MGSADEEILPFVLDALIQKPRMRDTFDNLCRDLENNCSVREKYSTKSIPNVVENALEIGEGLGIVTMRHEMIRMPFSLFPKSLYFMRRGEKKDNEDEQPSPSHPIDKPSNMMPNKNKNDNNPRNKGDGDDDKSETDIADKVDVFQPIPSKVKPRMPQIRRICPYHKNLRKRQRSRGGGKKKERRHSVRSKISRRNVRAKGQRLKTRTRSRKCR